jgi:mRNA interferase RelE/StbE
VNDQRYQLLIVSSARRQLTEDLPEAVAGAAFELITGPLLENPHRVGKLLRPPLADRHSARRGTHRVLYRIDEDARTVTVLAIGHRGDIYRGS